MPTAERAESPVKPREQRGERKRKRHEATRARRAAQEARRETLRKPPTSAMDAAARWDEFYRTKPTLFKDRHLLRGVLPEIVGPVAAADPAAHIPQLTRTDALAAAPDQFLLEAGCGSGSATFPLLRANPRLFALAVDLSAEAVATVRANTEFRRDRVHAFVADISVVDSFLPIVHAIAPSGVHFVTAIWTLSALPATTRRRAACALASALRPDGLLFVRDYAQGDMRESRFTQAGQKVGESDCSRLFLRGDGTYAYFFESAEIRSLFEDTGLVCDYCEYEDRQVHNRREETTMHRRWVVAKFHKAKQTCKANFTTSTS